MSDVLFVSDLHLGHRAILTHTQELAAEGAFRGGTNVDEHDDWVIEQCLKASPSKRTLWWIMGDVAMDLDKLALVRKLPGTRRLILGNHDLFPTKEYLKWFDHVSGPIRKYGLWLSHVPMHPEELRGSNNVHGHCHHHTLRDDPRYYNTAIEWLPHNEPISLDELRKHWQETSQGQEYV